MVDWTTATQAFRGGTVAWFSDSSWAWGRVASNAALKNVADESAASPPISGSSFAAHAFKSARAVANARCGAREAATCLEMLGGAVLSGWGCNALAAAYASRRGVTDKAVCND